MWPVGGYHICCCSCLSESSESCRSRRCIPVQACSWSAHLSFAGLLRFDGSIKERMVGLKARHSLFTLLYTLYLCQWLYLSAGAFSPAEYILPPL